MQWVHKRHKSFSKFKIKIQFNEQAAALLKRAEGIVNLVLCNPNKKEDGEDSKELVKAIEKGKPRKI